MKKIIYDELYNTISKKNRSKLNSFLETNGINCVDPDGRTILMTAIVEKDLDLVDQLISCGVDVNQPDKDGFTPLHFSVMHEFSSIIMLLIDHKADINAKDKWGNTPLWRAVMTNNKEAENILLESGSDPSIKNNSGVSANDLLNNE